MIDYNIISTGSIGNAVVVNSTILIDCGVPFKALKNVYKDLQLVLLTHIHSDHFNRTTIRKLAQERPTLRWGIPDWLACDMLDLVEPKNIDVFGIGLDHCYGEMIIMPFALTHNVSNCGYIISSSKFGRMLYATDTNSMDGIEAKNYDLYLIESNHTEDGIRERIQTKETAGDYVYEYSAMQNHLSKEKCDKWLLENMGSNSEFIYMHGHID